jgi:hypothetical protein
MSDDDKINHDKNKKNHNDNNLANIKTSKKNSNNSSSPLYYRDKTILAITILVITLLICDTALEKIIDLIGTSEMYSSHIRNFIFIFISAFVIGQYFLLSFIKHKIKTMAIYLKDLKKDTPHKPKNSLFHLSRSVFPSSFFSAASSSTSLQSHKRLQKFTVSLKSFFFDFFQAI